MRCPACGFGNSKRATECKDCGKPLAAEPEQSTYTKKERRYAHQSHVPWPGLGHVDKADPAHVSEILKDLRKKLGR